MDVLRNDRTRGTRAFVLSMTAIVVLGGGAWYATTSLLHGTTSMPSVARTAIVIDVARRETLVRTVRASGVLVPDRVHVVATAADGVVTSVGIRAGSRVAIDSEIAVLRNSDLDAVLADAGAQRTAALAAVRSAREDARAARLDREGAFQTAVAEEKSARDEAATDASLVQSGLIGTLKYRQAVVRADETRALANIARRKIDVGIADDAAKVALAQAAVDRIGAQMTATRSRIETLVVCAGAAGIVQSVTAEVGQRATPGLELARIADDRDLKAVLQVAEGDLAGVSAGRRARIASDGSAPIAGTVARIAPVAVNGTVAVDVALRAPLLGLRPAQNVDGTIELARIAGAVTIARPVSAGDGRDASFFRLTSDGARAIRVTVRLAPGSADRAIVASGLRPGERVIVSDMAAFAAIPELRITQ